jgi:hypothetical protein
MTEDLDLDMSSLQEDEVLSSFASDEYQKEETEEKETKETNEQKEKISKDEEKTNEEIIDDEVDDKKQSQTPSDNTDDDSSQFSLFASVLAEEGVLTDFNLDENKNKIKSANDLADLIKSEIRKNELAGLNEDQKEFLKSLEDGYSVDEFKNEKRNILEVEKLNEDSLYEDEDLQKQLIVDDLLSKGYSKEKAEKLTQRSFDIGENLDDAKDALISKKEKVKAEIDLQKQQRAEFAKKQEKEFKERQEKVKETVFNEKEFPFKEVKFNKQVADKVYSNLTKPVEFTKDGQPVSALQKQRMEDPVNFDYKMNLLFVLTDGFNDLSKLKNDSKSKAAEEFAKKIKNTSSSQNISSSDIDENINNFLQSYNNDND